ncbi:MAG: F0F1 ATP synthase subunit epsilon [Pyrinomonadaceae bacterium]
MLKLEIVTPERRVLDAEVDSVTVPTASGEAGIMPNHAPLVSVLKPGVLTYAARGASERLAVSGGFVEVNNDKIAVLVDMAEAADEIDIEQARADRDAAEKNLTSAALASAEDTEPIREAADHAAARLRVAER